MAIESVGGSIVSKITELLVEPVIKQFRYMFCFNNFVQEFSEQAERLVYALYHVQGAVNDAKRNAEEIEIDVDKWLEDTKKALALHGLQDAFNVAKRNAEEIKIHVNKCLEDAKKALALYVLQGAVDFATKNAEEIEIDVSKLLEGVKMKKENEKRKNGNCFMWCPKWIRQFKLSKALEKKTETLRKLEENSRDFRTKVSHKAPLQDIELLPSKEFRRLELSKEALEQIMKALKDDKVNMIGLYGMGGVGKTTLVKEVRRRAKEMQLFDEVLLATVSQNPNVMRIQDRMAESLGLKFDEKTIEGRASRLWPRLKTEKKLLVILDDVWKVVNLKEIGIPVGDDHRGCKVLLTTRHIGICYDMECQEKVLLRILFENEAWDLFKIKAGLRDEDFNLNTVAKEVARECQGLPIALVTVGKALRHKSVVEWEVASKELKNSKFQHMEQFGEENNAYACLKLSYDYLKHKETKLCFLLCCLFPEDYDIPIEDLTRYAVGYGIHQDVESIEDARKQVLVAINTLKDCCMLLRTGTEEKVKMHDLVRDVAIQIASKEHGFMVKSGTGLKEWPMRNKSFEGCTTISLMGNKLVELPEGLACPQLKVLLLELDRDLKVPERFFEGMKEIEFLSLEGGCLSLQSLEFSTNLKSLLLIYCQCNDLIWLRKLQRLEILGFIGCFSLEELPDEIGELKELRLLDVTGCRSLRRIPVNLIGRLKKLEELLIGDYSFEGWGVVGCDSTGGMNASLTELNLLSHLAVLSLRIPRVECIPRDFVFPRLLKYDIVLGNLYFRQQPTSTSLCLGDISVASLNAKTFEQLFPTVSQIGFINVEGLENINRCSGLKHLIGERDDEREIIQDSLGFPKLKTLSIRRCDKLEYVFPVSVSPSLPNLEEMEIECCANLKQIFYSGEGDALTRDGIINFPRLRELCLSSGCHFFGPKHFTAQFPSLQELSIDGHEELGDLLAQLQGLTNLRDIYITSSKGAQHLMQAGSFVPNRRTGHEWWQALKNLETMQIEHCESLEEVFELGEAGEGINEEKELRLLSSLTRLVLSSLPELKCIWKGPTKHVSLRSLVHLELRSLDKLTFIFTSHLAQSLVHLETLEICNCNELKRLIRVKDDEREIIPDGFPKLKTLSISHCDKLEYVFHVSVSPSLLNLEKIDISYGCNLKQIFYSGEGDAHTSDGVISFPRLRELSLSSGCSLFGPKNFTAQLPSLQVFFIKEHEEWGDLLAHLQGLTNLRVIRIYDCERAPELMQVGSFGTNGRTGHELSLLSLEKLDLSSLPDMRCIWKGLVLSHLTSLVVSSCQKLTHVFTGSMVASLVQLESLYISDCSELEQIIAKDNDDEKDQILSGSDLQSLCFPNLCEVQISDCNKLRSLFPVAMASGLPKLETLDVADSSQLLGVFGQDDDASPVNVEKQMVLPNLSSLWLFNLPSIVSFSPGCDYFLLHGHTNLREIRITECKGAHDLMQAGHELSLLSLEKLELRSMPDMRCIWKGLVLSHLTSLKVFECHKLTHVFTGSMVASLAQLRKIVISGCSELEQIIAKDNDDEKDQSLCFPNLCQVEIKVCNKLRSLFPVAMAAGLPKLEDLDVRDSSELLGVFGQDDDASPVNVEKQMVLPNLCTVYISGCNKLRSLFPVAMAIGLPKLHQLVVADSSELLGVFGQDDDASPVNVEKKMEFPNLYILWLFNLPSIVCFSLGCDDLSFPRLRYLEVDECPKLTTQFPNKTNGSTSAQSEVSQSSEDSSTSCSEPIKVD